MPLNSSESTCSTENVGGDVATGVVVDSLPSADNKKRCCHIHMSFFLLSSNKKFPRESLDQRVSILTWRDNPSDEASRFLQLMLYLPSSLLIVNCFLKGSWLKMDFLPKKSRP